MRDIGTDVNWGEMDVGHAKREKRFETVGSLTREGREESDVYSRIG